MIDFETRWFLETEYLATGWIHALHYGADGAVLAGGIHGLEYQQNGVAVTGCQHPLQFFQAVGCLSAMLSLMPMAVGDGNGAGLVIPKSAVERHEVR